MFKCRLWLHIGPPSTPFSTLEMQNSRVDSNQDSTGMIKSFAWTTNNTPFPLFCCQCVWRKSCTQFSFFQSIRQNAVNGGFRYSVLSTIILQLAQRLFFKTMATRAMFLFVFVVPSLPLHSVSSFNFSPAPNRLCYQNTVTRDTDESPNKHFPCFCSHKSCFTTKFYRSTLFKIFSHGNL